MLSSSARAFTPTDEEFEGGTHSGLAGWCMGDWSWKPGRPEREATLADYLGTRLVAAGTYTQGAPRPTTKFTPDGRIAQICIPPEKQARQLRTGDQPREMGSTMAAIWELIDERS